MSQIYADRIPGFLEALTRERLVRDWSVAGYVEPILGIEIHPLTLERLNLLILAENRYLCGGGVRLPDVLQFLWFASRAFTFDKPARTRFIRKHSGLVILRYEEANKAILAYLADAFIDVESTGEKRVHEPVASWVASHIFTVAKETGWSRDSIYREMPFNEVMQYVRLAERASGAVVFNPLSNEAKMRWLEGLNAPRNPQS